jgi:hypothetical protein
MKQNFAMIVYMSWAASRQLKYLFILFLFIGLIVFIFIYPSLNKAPTCFDNTQNGGESGVDCGGVCSKLCPSDVSEPVILWSRAFYLTGSTYNLVAFVENQNKNAAIVNASYQFKIYDTNNKLIGRREGSTFVPPNKRFAIFESRFDAGQSQVKSVSFEFTSPFVWEKKLPTLDLLPINVGNIIVGDNKESPTLTANISNDSIFDLPAFDVIVILYDINHNAINASKTHLDGIKSNNNVPILFTWPEAFTTDPTTRDILIQINPFMTSF